MLWEEAMDVCSMLQRKGREGEERDQKRGGANVLRVTKFWVFFLKYREAFSD